LDWAAQRRAALIVGLTSAAQIDTILPWRTFGAFLHKNGAASVDASEAIVAVCACVADENIYADSCWLCGEGLAVLLSSIPLRTVPVIPTLLHALFFRALVLQLDTDESFGALSAVGGSNTVPVLAQRGTGVIDSTPAVIRTALHGETVASISAYLHLPF